jgi:hypothetical protein
MNNIYDYIIVGGGPCGLTLAWYLAKNNYKVVLLDKNESLGGAHRVDRVNGMVTEHSPRVYIENYFILQQILKEFGYSFYDLFTKYEDNLSNISDIRSHMNITEIITFIWYYIQYAFGISNDKITVLEFMDTYKFSNKAKKYIDNICRVTDGAGADRYTMYELYELINKNILYNVYQPKRPNDTHLFKIFNDELLKTGNVDIINNAEVESINENEIRYVKGSSVLKIKGNNIILAIPPELLLKIIKDTKTPRYIQDSMYINKGIKEWEQYNGIKNIERVINETKYETYISIMFHWDEKFNIEGNGSSTNTNWNILYIIQSNYTHFDNKNSKTAISTAISNMNGISPYLNKTPNECTKEELIQETFRQLNEKFLGILPKPSYSLISSDIYRKGDEWESPDKSFMLTKTGYLDIKFDIPNIYSVGTHSGNANYSITTMESAMQNAVDLLHKISPETKKQVQIYKQLITINRLIYILISVISLLIIYKVNQY